MDFRFRLNFDVSTSTMDRRILQGDVPFRATIYDTEGNVWTRDFSYRFLVYQKILYYYSQSSKFTKPEPLKSGLLGSLENITTPELLTLENSREKKDKTNYNTNAKCV